MKNILNKKEVETALDRLEEFFPDAKAELNFTTPYELLVATILSAQCTDVRVNKITKELFKKANTPEEMRKLGQEELEREIYSCGFYSNKAKNILGASDMILKEYQGEVPSNMEDLLKIPGVGRKTANVVLSVAFDVPAIAVDTHVFRVTNRIGIVREKNPMSTEMTLMKRIRKERWNKSHHLFIFLGRRVCKAGRPLCNTCPLDDICMKRI